MFRIQRDPRVITAVIDKESSMNQGPRVISQAARHIIKARKLHQKAEQRSD